jgi:AbiJ N-terminal domain 4
MLFRKEMAIHETFSKRQARLAKAGQQDVYQYGSLPAPFRIQVVHILNGALGSYDENNRPSVTARFWKSIRDTMCREHGVFSLDDNTYSNPQQECTTYVQRAATDRALDIVEICFQTITGPLRKSGIKWGIEQGPDDAIEELNGRFKEHGIGYQFVKDFLIRIDSQFIHAEVVKPALSLLNIQGFEGPADEFFKAFEHHRHGRDKEAIVEALKSFESTIKAICKARNWQFESTATAKKLIETVFANGLIPSELQNHFSGLRAAMESGLPTVRNKTSGHGQGAVPTTIPPHITAYALHLAAANIVLLVEAHHAMK